MTIQSLRDAQIKAGAVFETEMETPVSFPDQAAVLQAARQGGVALCDRSHWGRLQITDADRLNFLHNQSTNDFKLLQPGQGCDTLFVTPTARTIDLATVYVLEDAALVLVSPNRRQKLSVWLDRYIFFGDRVKLTDITEATATFSLVGAASDALLERLGAAAIGSQPYANHQLFNLAGKEVRVAVGSGLALPGYTLLIGAADVAVVWETLVEAGALPLGERGWDQLRIEQGRPLPDQELTEDYNAVEACLWQAISINKGCYIGQETIARLDTYKGVKQQLWGIRLSGTAAPGTLITVGEEKVGILTSLTETEQGTVGLGYIRTKAGGVGLEVQVGDTAAEVIEVPFLRRDRT
jgi:folate-binding protein YgfZ